MPYTQAPVHTDNPTDYNCKVSVYLLQKHSKFSVTQLTQNRAILSFPYPQDLKYFLFCLSNLKSLYITLSAVGG